MATPEVPFDYNTQRPRLIIPEYGRHVQRLVEHCMDIEDREARTRSAHATIQPLARHRRPHPPVVAVQRLPRPRDHDRVRRRKHSLNLDLVHARL